MKDYIKHLVEPSDHCIDCEENLIKEELYCIVHDDDIEEALECARDIGKQCSGCRADEESDNRRM